MSRATVLTFLVATTCLPGWSQTITASLEGLITDPSGATVMGADVRVVNTDTNVPTVLTTDAAGRFLAPSLPPGPYEVTVKAAGFKTTERSGITLAVNQAARVEITLQIGSPTETVEVSAEAPLLDSSSAAIGQVVATRTIVDLPLNQRNPYSLVFLAPGVVGNVGNLYNNVNISINGGRPGSNAMMVDGVPSSTPLANPIQGFTIFPSVDAVQEFKVLAHSYSAEFGRSGGGIINLIYKSGTNEFHGSAFEFLRNSALDSNNFFSNTRGVPLANFRRNQFGGAAGGPVMLPRLYNGRNKTFFFAAYEGLRQSAAAAVNTTVPTQLQRNGDFSQTRTAAGANILIYDPATTVRSGSGYVRQAFPGNVMPLPRFDPVARNVVRYYPLPNGPGAPNTGADNYFVAGASRADNNQFDIKIDENLNANNRFFVRFSRRQWDPAPADFFPDEIRIAQGGVSTKDYFTNGAINYTATLDPTLLLEIRYGVGRALEKRIPRSLDFDPVQLGFPEYMGQGNALLFPGFTVAGYVELGNGGASQWGKLAFETHSVGANVIKVLPSHMLKAGFELRISRVNDVTGGDVGGGFSFARSFTQGPNPLAASATAGDAFASLLLGVGNGTLNWNTKNVAVQSPYYAFYIADDWKVSRRLTLNIGLRYGIDVPFTERFNRVNVFEPDVPSPLAGPAGLPGLKGGLTFAGVDGRSRRVIPIDWKGWDPRFGFAYQVAGRTVLRGGYGVFHGTTLRQAQSNLGQTGFGSSTSFVSAADGITPTDYLRNPFPQGLVPATGTSLGLLTGIGTAVGSHMPYDVASPYTQNWSFGLQQQLSGGILVEPSYVGHHGINLSDEGGTLKQLRPEQMALGGQLLTQVSNPFYGLITIGALSTPTIPYRSLLSPFPHFTGVTAHSPSGSSSVYHAFQLKVEKRFASGISFLMSYTGQKLIDDNSVTAVVGNNAGRQNVYDRRAERSVSANDVSRTLVVSSVFRLPFGRGQAIGSGWNRLFNAFLGGWQIGGIARLDTGYPLALTTQNTTQAGNPTLRPNNNDKSAKLDGPIVDRLRRYFDTSVLSQPAPYTFGNTGRVLPDVRTPGTRNLDLSVLKDFRMHERAALQFRAEAFNATNTPQFGRPNSSLNSVEFGAITSQANSPRQIQFGLKLLF